MHETYFFYCSGKNQQYFASSLNKSRIIDFEKNNNHVNNTFESTCLVLKQTQPDQSHLAHW